MIRLLARNRSPSISSLREEGFRTIASTSPRRASLYDKLKRDEMELDLEIYFILSNLNCIDRNILQIYIIPNDLISLPQDHIKRKKFRYIYISIHKRK